MTMKKKRSRKAPLKEEDKTGLMIPGGLAELIGDVDLEAAQAAAVDARDGEREDLRKDLGRPRITLKNVLLSVGKLTFEAIIVAHHRTNAYWEDARPKPGQRPDCMALDGINGRGDNGSGDGERKCIACPMNVFGTGEGGKSKACKNTRVLFLHRLDPRDEGTAPVEVLQVAPASIRNVSRYLEDFLVEKIDFFRHATTITAIDPPMGGWQFERGEELDESYSKVALALNYKHRQEHAALLTQLEEVIIEGDPVD